MGNLPKLQHQNKAHDVYNSPLKAVENLLDPSIAIENIYLSRVMSFLRSEYFPCPWLPSLVPYYPISQILLLWTFSLKLLFCPFSLLQAVGASVSMDGLAGLCDLATVGKCPETVPAHLFVLQYNLKNLCIRMFCLSEQYSALSALITDCVKDALKQF